jgi:hypothetical protein
MINPPGNGIDFDKIFQSDKLKIGDVFWTGQEVCSIEDTGRTEKLYNLILENETFYYVENVTCLTANAYASISIILLFDGFASGLDSELDKATIVRAKKLLTLKEKQAILEKLQDLIKKVCCGSLETIKKVYHDCSVITSFYTQMLESLSNNRAFRKSVKQITNYKLTSL